VPYGGITLNGGTLTSNFSDAIFGSYHVSASSGIITANGTGNLISAVDVGIGNTTLQLSTPLVGDTLTISSAIRFIQFFGALSKSGLGTVTLTGTNTYNYPTNIDAGTLRFAETDSLYNGSTGSWTKENIVVASGSTLAVNVGGAGEFNTGDVTTLLNNLTTSINNDGLQAGSNIAFDTTNASGGTFTVADNIANSTGTGSGSLGVTKLGTGTLVLTGTNAYSGGTTLTAGTLQVGHNSALSSGTLTFNGGTLGINGQTVTNSLVANASTTSSVVFGNSSGNLNGALTGTGTVNVSTSGTTAIAPALPNFSSFNGTVGIDLGPSLTNTFNPQINSNGAGAKFVVTGTGGFVYSGLSGNSTISLGELSGDGRIAGIFDAGSTTNHHLVNRGLEHQFDVQRRHHRQSLRRRCYCRDQGPRRRPDTPLGPTPTPAPRPSARARCNSAMVARRDHL